MKTKLLLSLIFALFAHSFGFAATITSAKSGDWNVGNTWIGGVVPGNLDDVKITSAYMIKVNDARTCNTIVFENSTLIVNSTLTVTGNITVDASISSNRDVVINGSGTLNCASFNLGNALNPSALHTTTIKSSISNFNITGNLTILSSVNGSITNNATFSLEGGTITLDGKIITANNGSSSTTKSVSRFEMTVSDVDKNLILNYGTDAPLTTSSNVTSEIVFEGLKSNVYYAKSGDQTIIKPIPKNGSTIESNYTNLFLIGGSGTKFFPNSPIKIDNRISIGTNTKADLMAGVTHTARFLSLGGDSQTRTGSWGSNSSTATNKNDTYFTASTGLLNVSNSTCPTATPIVQTITGTSGNYCSTTTIPTTTIGLSMTENGISYQLVLGSNNVGSAIIGTGAAMSFSSAVNTPGIYTVVATSSSMYCASLTATMTGSVVINTYDTPPVPIATKTDAHCATPDGNITVNTTISPAALTFGAGNYVDTNAKLLSNVAAFTVEGWVKFNPLNVSSNMSLFGQNDVVEFGINGGQIYCWTASGGSVGLPLSNNYPNDNVWHHLAVVGTGTNLLLYIDGVSKVITSGTTANYGSSTLSTVKIGAGVFNSGASSEPFTGQISKVGFWNRALSAAELAGLAGGFVKYNINQTGLLSGYNFAENTGTNLASVGSVGATGTLFQGTATAIPTWTDPYTYAWTGPNGFTSSFKDLTGLAFGDYSLTTSLKNCSSTIAAPIKVLSSTTGATTKTWNGNWSPSAPTNNDLIVFAGDYSLDENLSGCSCTVNVGKNVTIKKAKTLTIINQVVVTGSGTLTFEDQSSLVQVNNTPAIPNSGNITYNRNASLQKFDYSYWSTPVTNSANPLTLKNFSPNTVSNGYQVNTNGAWSFNTNGTATMAVGVGYAIMAPSTYTTTNATFTGIFTGVPNNGNLSVAPIGTWKLVGNPYPSALDVNKFIQGNSTLYGTVYFWAHTSRPISTNPGSYAYNYASSDYAVYNYTGGIATDPDRGEAVGYVPAGQSFFVAGWTNNPILFNNNMRVGGANNEKFYKVAKTDKKTKIAEAENGKLWLNLTNDEGLFKQILIGYVEGATNDYDVLYDGVSFSANTFANFYSFNNGANLAIQGRAVPFEELDEVPLGFVVNLAKNAAVKNTFTISINNTNGSLSNHPVYLFDKETNITYDLRKSGYNFTSFDGTFNDRFVVKYTNTTLGTDDFKNGANEVTVVVKNKIITVDAKLENIAKVVVYDLSGKTIYTREKINNSVVEISNVRIDNAVVVIKIILANGAVESRKVLLK